jgi:hypothetical protein
VPGQITVNLTGASTLAAYQAAIQAITFSSTSENPDPTDRIVHVTVKDELIESNVATTTIHVVAVNDVPNANSDSIVTNISGAGAVVIPDWALLANDTDVDSSSLTVGSIVSSSSANATHGSGAVTFTDTGSSATSNGGNNNGTMGSFVYQASDNAVPTPGTDNATATVTRDTGNIDAGGGNQIIVGDANGSTIDPGTGNDIVFAGNGNDSIVWNANTGTTDGHDFVDGGAGTDTFTINGNNSAETYRVYARADAIAAGITDINADTEIVITRNGTNNASVIAELDNVEEIQINTSGGADTVLAIGNFSPTSLNYSTITINGENGDDTVDITGLTSDHRIVFHGGRGDNHVIGDLRPQDVIENPDGHSGTSASSGQVNNAAIGNVRESDIDWRHVGEDALDYSAISANIAAVRGGGSYTALSAADTDRGAIAGFQPGDRIDLSAMDSGGEHSFVLFAGNLFNSAGQMIIDRDMQSGPEHTLISAGINGCTPADFKDDSGAGSHASPAGDFNHVH